MDQITRRPSLTDRRLWISAPNKDGQAAAGRVGSERGRPDLSREEIYSLVRRGVMSTVQFRNYHAYETPGGLSDR
jgi:hypothetical protein